MTKTKQPSKPRKAHANMYCATARKRIRNRIKAQDEVISSILQTLERVKLVIGTLTSQKELDMLETLTESESKDQKKILEW